MEKVSEVFLSSYVNNLSIIELPKVRDYRGNLAIIERDVLPFNISRVYYLYDVPSDASRGGHAHKELYELIIPLSGSFDMVVNDGTNSKTFTLNKPDKGLLLVPGIWREINNFSSGAVCLVLASLEYDESEYVRSYDEFLELKIKK